jgi:hypothetical protein
MNVYQVLIIVIVLFILLHELVPPAQAEIRNAFTRGKARLHYLRAFIDDDDYDAIGHFRNNPFTMRAYLTDREQTTWRDIRQRARRRQRQGWGSVHFDGPDFASPCEFWWRSGCLVRRRVPLDANQDDVDMSDLLPHRPPLPASSSSPHTSSPPTTITHHQHVYSDDNDE